MTREQIYGRRPVREALRGPREVLELWVTERALKAQPWLREPGLGTRSRVKPERDLTEAAGARGHQGGLARAGPYRYAGADELAGGGPPVPVRPHQGTPPPNPCAGAPPGGAAGAAGA